MSIIHIQNTFCIRINGLCVKRTSISRNPWILAISSCWFPLSQFREALQIDNPIIVQNTLIDFISSQFLFYIHYLYIYIGRQNVIIPCKVVVHSYKLVYSINFMNFMLFHYKPNSGLTITKLFPPTYIAKKLRHHRTYADWSKSKDKGTTDSVHLSIHTIQFYGYQKTWPILIWSVINYWWSVIILMGMTMAD